MAEPVSTQERIKIEHEKVGEHYISVLRIYENESKVEIKIESEPILVNMTIGKTRKFDLDGDGYYEISVTLLDMVEGKPKLEVKAISEPVKTEEEKQNKTEVSDGASTQQESKEKQTQEREGNKRITYFILTVALAIIIFVVLIIITSQKSKRRTKKTK